MKKTILSLMAIAIAIGFIACDNPVKTDEEMLTTKKGWVLTAATSDPAYESIEEGESSKDLFKVFYRDYEKDYVWTYNTDYTLQVDLGKTKPPVGEEEAFHELTKLGIWVLSGKNLTTKVPGFYDRDETTGIWIMDKTENVEITETTLKYEYTWRVDDSKKAPKGDRAPKLRKDGKGDEPEKYTFTLTFTAK